jgi:transcriptional regulator with XRE-family HTH domain
MPGIARRFADLDGDPAFSGRYVRSANVRIRNAARSPSIDDPRTPERPAIERTFRNQVITQGERTPRRSPVTSPFVRRRRLAAEIRALREEQDMTAEDLARLLHRSRMKISKLENARVRPDLAEIMKILDLLGVTGDRWQQIVTIARDAAERGWWDTYGDSMGPRQRLYADIESGAETIRGYNQSNIPGLLQTPEFTWALIELDNAERDWLGYLPERCVEARQKRQEVAFRSGGPHVEMILDEFVLRRLAVPAPVMASQLRHVVRAVTDQPRFTVRVLPLDARLSPGRLPQSAFVTYTFPDRDDPPMAVAETGHTDLVHTLPHEVARYERQYERLQQVSLPALESLSLLADAADRLSEETDSPRESESPLAQVQPQQP